MSNLTMLAVWQDMTYLVILPHSFGVKAKREEKMDNTKLLRYSLQLSMLKQLLQLKLISEKEYQLIEKTIKKDYSVVSSITT